MQERLAADLATQAKGTEKKSAEALRQKEAAWKEREAALAAQLKEAQRKADAREGELKKEVSSLKNEKKRLERDVAYAKDALEARKEASSSSSSGATSGSVKEAIKKAEHLLNEDPRFQLYEGWFLKKQDSHDLPP